MLCFMNAMLKGKFETLNACIRIEKKIEKSGLPQEVRKT